MQIWRVFIAGMGVGKIWQRDQFQTELYLPETVYFEEALWGETFLWYSQQQNKGNELVKDWRKNKI